MFSHVNLFQNSRSDTDLVNKTALSDCSPVRMLLQVCFHPQMAVISYIRTCPGNFYNYVQGMCWAQDARKTECLKNQVCNINNLYLLMEIQGTFKSPLDVYLQMSKCH